MDRFVIREPRTGREYPEGNQMMACSATSNGTGNNITIPENIYYGGYGGEVQNTNVQQLAAHGLVTHVQAYSPNVVQAQGPTGSGIDPRYLAAHASNNAVYADNNAAYAHATHGGNLASPAAFNTFGSDYQSHSFTGAETNNRNFNKTQANNYNFNRADANYSNFNRADANYSNFNRADANYSNFNRADANYSNFNRADANYQNLNKADANIHKDFNRVDVINHNLNRGQINNAMPGVQTNNLNSNATNMNNRNFNTIESNSNNFNRAEPSNNFNRAQINNQNFNGGRENNRNFNGAEASNQNLKGAERNENKPFVQTKPNVASKNQTEIDTLKDEPEVQVKTRGEKLKELHKFGTRVYSGPVEKILKWHKSIQDIGVLVLYEIVGKCVNVRAGESCSKNLVVRDENGPAIQVVYYEIDFFLPDLKPPCTVRVIGRMMPGTSRFQAFNVRPATGDDLATLPRRAAVAAHHVAKLAKDYGIEVLTLK